MGLLSRIVKAVGRHVTFSTDPNVGDTPDMARFKVDREGSFKTTQEKLLEATDEPRRPGRDRGGS